MEFLETLTQQANQAMTQLLEQAHTKPGQIVVVGCSSSEAGGYRIGSHSALEIAQAIFDGLYPVVQQHGMYLAAQCCEHLNRALIVEEECMEKYGVEQVNAVPQPKAGGNFGTTAWARFSHPVAVERIQAHCGMDIGDTLIGMHLKPVAVPLRLDLDHIGHAHLVCARTRIKFTGGSRAVYQEDLL